MFPDVQRAIIVGWSREDQGTVVGIKRGHHLKVSRTILREGIEMNVGKDEGFSQLVDGRILASL